MTDQKAFYEYLLQLADNVMILGHRLAEWCGHGPVLEQDIALTNTSLDLIGHARNLYQYAAAIENKGRTEDDLAYLRMEKEYRNLLLVEQPNGDFGQTIMRQFLFDHFNLLLFERLMQSADQSLSEIAAKSIKEIKYHVRFSSEWVIRLGDGTEESHRRMQNAIDTLWMFTGEMFDPSEADLAMQAEGIAPDLNLIFPVWKDKTGYVLQEAGLKPPDSRWFQKGGKQGNHSEHFGYILAELQYMQRAYPGMEW